MAVIYVFYTFYFVKIFFWVSASKNQTSKQNIEVVRRTVGQTDKRSLRGIFDTVAWYTIATPLRIRIRIPIPHPPHTVEVKLRPSDGWSVSFDVNVVTFIMSARPREQAETWLSPVHHLCQRLGIRLVMPHNPWPRVPFGVMLFPLQMTYIRLALARN